MLLQAFGGCGGSKLLGSFFHRLQGGIGLLFQARRLTPQRAQQMIPIQLMYLYRRSFGSRRQPGASITGKLGTRWPVQQSTTPRLAIAVGLSAQSVDVQTVVPNDQQIGLPVGIKLIPGQCFANLGLPTLIDRRRRTFNFLQDPVDPAQRWLRIQKFSQTHPHIPLAHPHFGQNHTASSQAINIDRDLFFVPMRTVWPWLQSLSQYFVPFGGYVINRLSRHRIAVSQLTGCPMRPGRRQHRNRNLRPLVAGYIISSYAHRFSLTIGLRHPNNELN